MVSKQKVAWAAEVPIYDGNGACAGPAQSRQSELCQLSGHSQHAASMDSKQKVAVAAGMLVNNIVASMTGRHRSSSACVMAASVVVASAVVPHVVLAAVIAACVVAAFVVVAPTIVPPVVLAVVLVAVVAHPVYQIMVRVAAQWLELGC